MKPTRRTALSTPLRALGYALLLMLFASWAAAQTPTLPLEQLDGRNGFKLVTEQAADGNRVAVGGAGDVNGDGLDDLIIGVYAAPTSTGPGRSYVVFGRRNGHPASIQLASLDGSNGFAIDGESASDAAGFAVSAAGDVNGDGFDDILIGAPGHSTARGRSFVLFGREAGFAARVALARLGGSDGFALIGDVQGTQSGVALSGGGDINGDGLDDLLIGAPSSSFIWGGRGYAHVVFGRRTGFPAALQLATLAAGDIVKVDGEAALSLGLAARAVSVRGDLNGDGLSDLLIGAPQSNYFSVTEQGHAYALFGRVDGLPASQSLSDLTGSNGFKIADGPPGAAFGSAMSAGDFNGDGVDDALIGARFVSTGDLQLHGSTYVIYGRSTPVQPAVAIPQLTAAQGYRLDGNDFRGESGTDVSAADINGDGLDDLIIGAPSSLPEGLGATGNVFVIHGRRGNVEAPLQLNQLAAGVGFKLAGERLTDRAGNRVGAAGDVNGDGVADLVLATRGFGEPDRVYLIFGAREAIFVDGLEAEHVVQHHPRQQVRRTARGSSLRWQTGAQCHCANAEFNFNVSLSAAGMTFRWPASGSNGAVATDGVYRVLGTGAVIGSESSFSTSNDVQATAQWRAGADGFLGFRFVNPDSGQVNYGYARVKSTPPSGYPMRIVAVNYNANGQAITTPSP